MSPTLSCDSPEAARSSLGAHSSPTAPQRLRERVALATLFAIALALTSLGAGNAEAACNPDPPSDDDAVVCDGMDETGFDGSGATGLTVTTSGITVIDDSSALDSGLLIGDDNTVTLGVDATVNVTEANGFGVRAGDRNEITNEGTINVNATGGIGIQGRDGEDIPPVPPDTIFGQDGTITNNGSIVINGAMTPGAGDNTVGIDVRNNYHVITSAGSSITIDGDNAVGIRGVDNNFINSSGDITITGDDARGIQINENTGLPLSNGAVSRGTIIINGDRGYAIEVGNNTGVLTGGTIDLDGTGNRGLSAGDLADPTAEANITNTGFIAVTGDSSYGYKVGDGWISGGATPSSAGVRNQRGILVDADNSYGIFSGNEANVAGNHNSFVLNVDGPSGQAAIRVNGTDSIGVSLGGNDLLDPGVASLDDLHTFENRRLVSGDEDAGALIEFRNSFGNFENRIFNTSGAEITADLTNLGMPNRAIAIMGSSGIERITNDGTITGLILLGDGDDIIENSGDLVTGADMGDGNDTYSQVPTSASLLTGTVDGGAGAGDVVELQANPGPVATANLSQFVNFEIVRLAGGATTDSGWALSNSGGFTGLVDVEANGVLTAMAPTTIGGDLVVDPTAEVRIQVNPNGSAITVNGDATLDGAVVVTSPGVLPGTYRLVQVDGTLTGTFDPGMTTLPSSAGLIAFSSSYDANGFLLTATNMGSFVGVAQGANNRAISAHLDDIFNTGTASPEFNMLLGEYAAGSDPLNDLFSAISPEAYDAQTAVAVESGRRIANLLFDRPRDCAPGTLDPWAASSKPLACHKRGLSAWMTGLGSFRSRDAYAGHSEYDATMGGVMLGIDYVPTDALEFTLALSGQRGTVDVQAFGESDLSIAELTGLASWTHGGLRVQGVLGYGHGFHDSQRTASFDAATTDVNYTAEDGFHSRRVTLAGHAGYLVNAGPIAVEPHASIDYVYIEQDSISEGPDPFSNQIDERDDNIVAATAGIRLSTLYHHTRYLNPALEWMDGIWRPTVAARWRQYLTGSDRSIDSRLTGAPAGVNGFTIDAREDQGGFEVEAGLSFVPKHANRLQFDVRYEAYRSAHTLEHDLVARVRIGF